MKLDSVLEAADFIGCDANHVYYLINMGILHGFKVRWIYRINHATVEEYAARRREERARDNASAYSEYPGYLFDPTGFTFNNPARIAPQGRSTGIPCRRRVEYSEGGFPRVSGSQRHAVVQPRPEQYELDIA